MWSAREQELKSKIEDLTSELAMKESLTTELVSEIRDMRAEINELVSGQSMLLNYIQISNVTVQPLPAP